MGASRSPRFLRVLAVAAGLVLGACGEGAGAPSPSSPVASDTTAPATQTPSASPPSPSATFPSIASPTPPSTEIPGGAVGVEVVAEGLVSPVALVQLSDGRLLVADQTGLVWTTGAGGGEPRPYLDLRDRIVELTPDYDERGLLGLALHPGFADNGRLFVYYTAPGGPLEGYVERVSEFTASPPDAGRADPATERVVLEDPRDSVVRNHNGGQVAFGPDGMLYVGIGDGEVPENGQDPETFKGKILRVDVDGAAPYAIPPDNPFAAGPGLDEIYALGLRNPYRFSFAPDGRLLVADVGADDWEEVDDVVLGGNYGWPEHEGDHCRGTVITVQEGGCATTAADGSPLLPPVLEYDHLTGRSIVGGHVYRGDAVPALRGRYVFGDWDPATSTGELALFAARPAPTGPWSFEEVPLVSPEGVDLGAPYLLSVAEGLDLELYLLTNDGIGPSGESGRVWRVVAAG